MSFDSWEKRKVVGIKSEWGTDNLAVSDARASGRLGGETAAVWPLLRSLMYQIHGITIQNILSMDDFSLTGIWVFIVK